MSSNKITIIIATILLSFSVSLPIMNYFVSLNSAEENLKVSSLPLSVDNIYSEIQTQLIEPTIVSSMMAQDTFLQDWLIRNEKDTKKIQKYLESIKYKYQMHTVFLTSQETQNYYSDKGFVEKMAKDNPANSWYYEFKDKPEPYEVNIDFNKHVDNSMIMFINHKILDAKYNLLGMTGVGLKLSYIDEMLQKFREKYKFRVFFVAKDARIIIQEDRKDAISSLEENSELYEHKSALFSHKKQMIHYEKNGEDLLVNIKYIDELNAYLFIEAKISDFTDDVTKTFYINLLISFSVTLVIIVFILSMIKTHSRKLEDIANYDALTKLYTRRVFDSKMKSLLLLNARKAINMSIIFLDIDDFKNVNDTFGHDVGDKVLVRIGNILESSIRETDFVARWGGEEFIIGLMESSLKDSQKVAEQIRIKISQDQILGDLLSESITASFGLTQVKEKDTMETLINRVDTVLYEAKNTGKNRVVLA